MRSKRAFSLLKERFYVTRLLPIILYNINLHAQYAKWLFCYHFVIIVTYS